MHTRTLANTSARRVIDPQRYKHLLSQEALHWGSVQPDPQNPQIWHDDHLFEIFFGREYRHFIDRIVSSGSHVLELGCGEGYLALDLARRGIHVTALDLSRERIERAQHRAKNSVLPVVAKFKVADLNTATLPKQKFDAVLAHDALHHLYKLDHVLDEVKKTLKPNGRLLTMDYIGMQRVRKLAAAFLYAVLPTYQPYRFKWQLRHRLKAFLASESSKRGAIETGNQEVLHLDSPFEEISQESMIQKIRERFEIVELSTFCPFGYYLAPKIRLPRSFKYHAAKFLKEMDEELLNLGIPGAYVFIAAQKV